MYYSNQPLSKRLFSTDEALTIAETDATVADVMAVYGFTPERLAQGRDLYNETFAAYDRRRDLFAAQMQATERMNTLLKAFRTQYSNDRRIVRAVLEKKRSVLEPFGLNENLKNARESLVDQAKRFYAATTGSEIVMARLLERYQMTSSVIDARLAELGVLVEAINAQQVNRAEAQVATQRRQEAMEQLDKWMSDFIAVARRAFKEDRKQLEKLGLKVVLNPTDEEAKKKKEEEAKKQEEEQKQAEAAEVQQTEGTIEEAPADEA